MNTIPPFELTRQYQLIREETEAAVLAVLSSGRYIGGAAITEFEQQFASYIGVSECVACNSGTDALYLALRALNVGPGDEVITTAFSFIATAETISLTGATPVFVDIDLKTFNLNVEAAAAAITSKTKAILPVHLFGQPVEMTKLMALARQRGVAVVEDCAQATGAEWSGQKVGSIGQVGCFSFYPTKNLGACGDGGAVTTNDPDIAAQIRRLGDHGKSDRYIHEAVGVNSRLDAVQAAILQIKLRYLDEWNQQRREIAARYHELLQPMGIRVPQEPALARSVWNQYTVLLSDRERVRGHLQQLSIGSTVYYPLPLPLQPVYQQLGYQRGQLPQSEQAARAVLSLPMFPELSSVEQQQVAYGLKDCIEFRQH
ncbi:MAG: DegT/DnrJ/EryC1/StrS family aminotransferase [Cyanophyceae cyanobacterium]